MPYFRWTLVPPPSGTLPPLMMAWPPISRSASTRITEHPASRAPIAAGSPVAPAPITTTSASRFQSTGFRDVAAPGAALPNVHVIVLSPSHEDMPERPDAVDREDHCPENTGSPGSAFGGAGNARHRKFAGQHLASAGAALRPRSCRRDPMAGRWRQRRDPRRLV